MASEYGTFAVGGVTFPLDPGSPNTALQDADPALYQAIAFWKGVLQIHLGDRWDAAVEAIGLGGLVGNIVASTAPYDPVPVFQDAQFKLPLLAAYRMKATYGERTVTRLQEIGAWGFDWILPPLTTGQLEALYPFLAAAAKAILDRTQQGWDPAYQAGAKVWTLAGLDSIGIVSGAFTWLQNRGPSAHGAAANVNTPFPLLHLEMQVRERQNDVAGAFPPMEGADATVTNQTSDSDPLPIAIAPFSVGLSVGGGAGLLLDLPPT